MAELTSARETGASCCSADAQSTCCEPERKNACCGMAMARGTCGCSAGSLDGIRETVRERYAASARAVATPVARLLDTLAGRVGFRLAGIQERHGRLEGEWKDLSLVDRLFGDAARGR